MTTTYGIWYDDGRFQSGWLHQESGNGRSDRYEVTDLAEAQAYAKAQGEFDKTTLYFAEPADGEYRERFRRCKRAALEHRLERALTEVESIRRMIEHHDRKEL